MEQRDDGAERGSDRSTDTATGTATGVRSVIRRELQTAATGPTGDLYRNFGDGFTRAFELAVTPVIFGAAGYGLDRWIGILPVFTLIFTLAAVIGLLLRTWYGYTQRMEALEQAAPWARQP